MRAMLLVAAALTATTTVLEAQVVARSYSRTSDDDRAALGINTATSGSDRDTLGLLIVSVVVGSPAEKAGLEEGNRIQSINGANLRMARADAGERDMEGVMTRRLVRELRKVKPGDEVELRVYGGGQVRTVKVKTIEAEELNALSRRSMRDREDRAESAVIGLSFGGGGSLRDTLGIFVSSVVEGGPAEKAGIFEGARIAAINGTDLRLSREDAGDAHLANAKANRFRRIMRDVKAGDAVELRVYMGGQTRTVRVTTDEYEDVYKGRRGSFFFSEIGPGAAWHMPHFEMAPLAPLPPLPPIAPGRVQIMEDAARAAERAAGRAALAGERIEHRARLLDERARQRAAEIARRSVTM